MAHVLEKSSDSSCESHGSFNTRIVCECGLQSRYRISHSLKNPNRPYLRCPKLQGCQCNFFKWVDELGSGDIRKLLEVDSGDERQKLFYEEWARMNKSDELQAKVIALKNTKKKMKKELMYSRIVICFLFICILSSKLGVSNI